jgi:hypothetical protein
MNTSAAALDTAHPTHTRPRLDYAGNASVRLAITAAAPAG